MGKEVGLQGNWFIRNIKTSRLSFYVHHLKSFMNINCGDYSFAVIGSTKHIYPHTHCPGYERKPATYKSMKCSHYLKCAIAP